MPWQQLIQLVAVALFFLAFFENAAAIFPSRLVHRFSDEAREVRKAEDGSFLWPERRSLEYYGELVRRDFQRQKMKLGPKNQLVFPSQGSKTMFFGDDFGWLHYTWIDIGTPVVSFLVALDVGSDLLWLPCNCVKCASLSASNYRILDRDLSEYKPSASSTSRLIPCSHHLCESFDCKGPKQQCPYTVNYNTVDTSSSGLLVEDKLHLASATHNTMNTSMQAPVIIGCGMKQTGGYLDGVAPDGLMGLGLGDISVPSLISKAGFVSDSFSLCFSEEDSGRIYFGDKGPGNQQATQFLPLDGKYVTYLVGVEECCIGNSCLKQTSFQALIDSGSSFTFLPNEVYQTIAKEFHRRINATITSIPNYPWKYCYKTSGQQLPRVPSMKFMFPLNNSFVVHDPIFVIYGMQGIAGFCLAIQPAGGDIGTIGQNFMYGYRMVFDRENMRLGWSPSNCEDLTDGKDMALAPTKGHTSNPLPTNEQQNEPSRHAVAPAVAGKATSKPSIASAQVESLHFCSSKLLPLLFLSHIVVSSLQVDTRTY